MVSLKSQMPMIPLSMCCYVFRYDDIAISMSVSNPVPLPKSVPAPSTDTITMLLPWLLLGMKFFTAMLTIISTIATEGHYFMSPLLSAITPPY